MFEMGYLDLLFLPSQCILGYFCLFVDDGRQHEYITSNGILVFLTVAERSLE